MNLDPQPSALLVVLKCPTPGQVKTRLAATIGNEEAASLYRQWISLVLNELQPLRGDVRLIGYYDGAAQEEFKEWQSLADQWWPQPTGDLGCRLEMGFQKSFATGVRTCIAVGTDCLELESRDVSDTIESLDHHDAVFGPTKDGGYYLVGTRSLLPGFFHGIRWSSSHTLEDQLRRCASMSWSVGLLRLRRDIDTYADLVAFRELANRAKTSGPNSSPQE